MKDSDWDRSAPGWLKAMGDSGDLARRDILDAPMMAHAKASGAVNALDVGCGEGRFCRMLKAAGMTATGIDPTVSLLEQARALDPNTPYLEAVAEDLPFEDGSFDLVVSYLSLIDIPDFRAGIAEMTRVLADGGTLLVANLQAFATARPESYPPEQGLWVEDAGGPHHWGFDDYMTERPQEVAWGDIRIINWHRPMSAYMSAFLSAGLTLTSFEEPPYTGQSKERAALYPRAPWVYLMAWKKPE